MILKLFDIQKEFSLFSQYALYHLLWPLRPYVCRGFSAELEVDGTVRMPNPGIEYIRTSEFHVQRD